jgi:hypothetical protein
LQTSFNAVDTGAALMNWGRAPNIVTMVGISFEGIIVIIYLE